PFPVWYVIWLRPVFCSIWPEYRIVGMRSELGPARFRPKRNLLQLRFGERQLPPRDCSPTQTVVVHDSAAPTKKYHVTAVLAVSELQQSVTAIVKAASRVSKDCATARVFVGRRRGEQPLEIASQEMDSHRRQLRHGSSARESQAMTFDLHHVQDG